MKRVVLIAFVCGHVGYVGYVGHAGLFAETAGQAPRKSQLFNSAALLSDLKTLSSDAMNGRAVDSPDGAKARAFLAERLTAAGLKPFGTSSMNASAFEQPFTFKAGGRAGAPVVERHGVNLVGEIKGRRQPARYVVVTAHYDHLAPRNGVVMNGADDNASGAAALVAITEYFVKHRPDNSLIIVACDAEEVGLRGAEAFVMNPPVPAASLVVNVNLDMIGRDSDDKLFAVGTLLSPYLKPLVEEVAKTAPVKLLIGHDDWTRDSDHYQFWTVLKMPFIYLGVEDESQHHKATDDYETITHDFYIRAVETSIALIRNFDKNLDRIQKGRPS